MLRKNTAVKYFFSKFCMTFRFWNKLNVVVLYEWNPYRAYIFICRLYYVQLFFSIFIISYKGLGYNFMIGIEYIDHIVDSYGSLFVCVMCVGAGSVPQAGQGAEQPVRPHRTLLISCNTQTNVTNLWQCLISFISRLEIHVPILIEVHTKIIGGKLVTRALTKLEDFDLNSNKEIFIFLFFTYR